MCESSSASPTRSCVCEKIVDINSMEDPNNSSVLLKVAAFVNISLTYTSKCMRNRKKILKPVNVSPGYHPLATYLLKLVFVRF